MISNRADAPGLDHATRAGIETLVLSHKAYATREDYDRALVAELKSAASRSSASPGSCAC